MIFDTSRYPPSINIVWLPIGIFMLFHAVRGITRGKFENRGGVRTTRADFPLVFWSEVAGSLTFGTVCILVGAMHLRDLWQG